MRKWFLAYEHEHGHVTRFMVNSRMDCLHLLQRYPEFIQGSYVEEKLIFTDGLDFITTYDLIEEFKIVDMLESLTTFDYEAILNAHNVPYKMRVTDSAAELSYYDSCLFLAITENIKRKEYMQYIIDNCY